MSALQSSSRVKSPCLLPGNERPSFGNRSTVEGTADEGRADGAADEVIGLEDSESEKQSISDDDEVEFIGMRDDTDTSHSFIERSRFRSTSGSIQSKSHGLELSPHAERPKAFASVTSNRPEQPSSGFEEMPRSNTAPASPASRAGWNSVCQAMDNLTKATTDQVAEISDLRREIGAWIVRVDQDIANLKDARREQGVHESNVIAEGPPPVNSPIIIRTPIERVRSVAYALKIGLINMILTWFALASNESI